MGNLGKKDIGETTSLFFDGTDDWVTIGTGSFTASKRVSISAWIFIQDIDSNSEPSTVLCKGPANQTINEYMVQVTTSGAIRWGYDADATTFRGVTTSTADILACQWYHITCTFDGTTWKVYRDGTLIGSNEDPVNLPGIGGIDFGRNRRDSTNFKDYFSGLLKEVRIFNDVLREDYIQSLYLGENVPDNSLLAYWKINDGSGTTVTDELGNFNGTTNGPVWHLASICSKEGSALSVDILDRKLIQGDEIKSVTYEVSGKGGGTNAALQFSDYTDDELNVLKIGTDREQGYIEFDSDASSIGNTSAFTYSFWIKAQDDYLQTVWSIGQSGSDSYFALKTGDDEVSDSLITIEKVDSGSTLFSRTYVTTNRNELFDGRWHHIVLKEVTGTNWELFLDGRSVDISSGTGTFSSGDVSSITPVNRATIGSLRKNGINEEQFEGYVREFYKWQRTLTDNEIRDLTEGKSVSTTSLVLECHINEGTGTTINDTSSVAYNGSSNGACEWRRDARFFQDNLAQWENGNGDEVKVNGCFEFDGVDDFLSGPTAPLDFGSLPITFSAWVFPNDTSDNSKNNIFSGYVTDENDSFTIGLRGEKIFWRPSNGVADATGLITGNTPVTLNRKGAIVSAGRWWHILIVINGITGADADFDLYVNGSEFIRSYYLVNTDVSYMGTAAPDLSEKVLIGKTFSSSNPNYFNGKIANVQIWDKALTRNEAQNVFKGLDYQESNLKAWYKIDKNIFDYSSSNDHLDTISGAIPQTNKTFAIQQGDKLNKDNNSLFFDGSNDVVSTSADASLDTTDVTASAWIKIKNKDTAEAGSSIKNIVAKANGGTSGRGWAMNFKPVTSSTAPAFTEQLRFRTFNPTDDLLADVNLEVGIWNHVAMSYNSSNDEKKIYLNGTLIGSHIASAAMSQNSSVGVNIGSFATSSRFGGDIANVAIWDDVRTDQEIQDDFKNGYIDTTDGNLIGYWPLDEGSGTTAINQQGNSNINGTLNGPTWHGDSNRPIVEAFSSNIDFPVSFSNNFRYRFVGTEDFTGGASLSKITFHSEIQESSSSSSSSLGTSSSSSSEGTSSSSSSSSPGP